ncbi:DUF4255 domain-containing protein [Mycetohabitans sp. B46]|uniref:DUF4255 domain-containing protein n=1 Tax=Mycetohabitans sp. B46 TaxID=2772536 RepID=UPI00307D0105
MESNQPTHFALSDKSLLMLNAQIEMTLNTYLPKPVEIRFDMPDKDNPPDCPTLCVFLYDIQEDLELRHGQSRQYVAGTGKFDPRQVNVRCCYLITYWERRPENKMGPVSQPMVVMNAVLNALLNADWDKSLRNNLNLPSFSRVIAPSEHLSGLGNFWQSLDDRPRLCLNFQVTIPIKLGLGQAEKEQPVLNAQLMPSAAQSWEDYDKSLSFKRVLVDKVLALLAIEQVQLARVQLARLAVTCEYTNPNEPPTAHVSGLLDEETHEVLSRVINENEDEWRRLGVQVPVDVQEVTGVKIFVDDAG